MTKWNEQPFDEDAEAFRNEYPKLAMTEGERLEKKRMEAGTAFELNHPPIKRSRLEHFGIGHGMY